MIPEDEIWVKLGGDKGGESFKMSLQIVNTPHPNSVNNTFVFTVFEAKDTTTNLLTALERYMPQVKNLQTLSWRYSTALYINFNTTVHKKIERRYACISLLEILLHTYFTTYIHALTPTGGRKLEFFYLETTNFWVKLMEYLEQVVIKLLHVYVWNKK